MRPEAMVIVASGAARSRAPGAPARHQRAWMGRRDSVGVGKVAFPTNKNALGRETGPAAATTTKAVVGPRLRPPQARYRASFSAMAASIRFVSS